MKKSCWCGNTDLVQWSDAYYRCNVCETLISIYTDCAEEEGLFAPKDEQRSLYGSNYWKEKTMQQYRKMHCDDIEDALILHYRERAGLWLSAIMRHILPPATVLEVGCGLGSLTRWMQDLGYEARALELSRQWTEHLRQEVGIKVDVGTMGPLQSGECKTDAIVLMDVLEHISDPVSFMKNAISMLSNDGILCIQTPKYSEKVSFSYLQQTNARFIRQLIPNEHLFLFSAAALERLVREHGFVHSVHYPTLGVDDMFYIFSRKPLKQYSPLQIKKTFMAIPERITAYAAYVNYLHLAALQQQNATLKTIIQNISETMRGHALADDGLPTSPSVKAHPLPPGFSAQEVAKLLYIRLDGIGDSILANALLEHLPTIFPKARITVACDAAAATLYAAAPMVAEVLPIEKSRLDDPDYLLQCIKLLRAVKANVVFQGTRSPTMSVAALSLALEIPVMGLRANAVNMSPSERDFYNAALASQWAPHPGTSNEMATYREILRQLGAPLPCLKPKIWLPAAARSAADALWAQCGLALGHTIAIFCGGGDRQRDCPFVGEALSRCCQKYNLAVVALGSSREKAINEKNISALRTQGIAAVNLSGKTDFLTSAALLARCRLAVGVDTSFAHAAAALQVPQVIVLGGADMGRFLPSSPKTLALCLPLECAGCNWRCRYAERHCLTGISPDCLAQAVETALTGVWPETGAGRIVLQPPHTWPRAAGRPRWRSPQALMRQQGALGDEDRICIEPLAAYCRKHSA